MRVVATEYVSLDGVFSEPGVWSGPFFSDEVGAFKFAELRASDALLLGRKTYEGFAAAWPTMGELGEFADKMNTMDKYVVSSRLKTADWPGSQIIEGDPVEAVRALATRPGGDLLLSGSGQLFNAMLAADLIDRYRLLLFPVVLGSGPKLFTDGNPKSTLTLVDTVTFGTGAMILEYGRAAG